jgi:hypothetical protein
LITVTPLVVLSIAKSSPELVHFGWRTLGDYRLEQLRRILLARAGRLAVSVPQLFVCLFVCETIIVLYYLQPGADK